MSKTKFSFRLKRLIASLGIASYGHMAEDIAAALRLESRIAERRGKGMAVMGIGAVDKGFLESYEQQRAVVDAQREEIAKLRVEVEQYRSSVKALAECVDRVSSERDALRDERDASANGRPEFIGLPDTWVCSTLHSGVHYKRMCPRDCDYRKAWEAAGRPK